MLLHLSVPLIEQKVKFGAMFVSTKGKRLSSQVSVHTQSVMLSGDVIRLRIE